MKKEKFHYLRVVVLPAIMIMLSSFMAGNFYILGPLIMGYIYFFHIDKNEEKIAISRLGALAFLTIGEIIRGVLSSNLKPFDQKIISLIVIHIMIFIFFALFAKYKESLKRG